MKKLFRHTSFAACVCVIATAFSSAMADDAALAPLPLPPAMVAPMPPAPAPSHTAGSATAMPEVKLPDISSLVPALPPLPAGATTGAAKTSANEPFDVPPLPSPNPPAFTSATTNKKSTATLDNVPPPVSLAQAEESKPAKKAPHGKKKRHVTRVAKSNQPPKLSETYYISEPLPESIYRKSYDRLNRHLPVAYYERDYDRLVFTTAAHDDVNGLRALLDDGRNVELMDVAGDTPLLVAVRNNAINTARLLLAHRANPEVIDRQGMSPLQIATRTGNYPMQRALIEMGANTATTTTASLSNAGAH